MTTAEPAVRPAESSRNSGRAPRATRHGGARSPLLTGLMALSLLYCLLPLAWLVLSSSKTQGDLFDTFGLGPGHSFALWSNLREVFTYQNGIFGRWLLNTVLYAVLGAGGATVVATLAGYGLAKFTFPGRRLIFAVVLGAIAVPGTALAVPTFLLFSRLGLTNTVWAVIIPSLISPFGMYLIWVYAVDAVPDELLEAARLDGAGEWRILRSVVVRILAPGIVTVLLFSMVATWNNYFLPLIMLSDSDLFPLAVGLNQWNQQAATVGSSPVYHLVITGSLITVVPLVVAFLLLQRFWQSGLTTGSVK